MVVVDWVGAGRVAGGERWAFEAYHSRSEYRWEEEVEASAEASASAPWLIEALTLGQRWDGDTDLASSTAVGPYDAAVSVVAIGPRAAGVAARLEAPSLARLFGASPLEREMLVARDGR